MSFPVASQMQASQAVSELCLRFPDNIGIHSQISYEQAMSLLSQAADMAQRVPFAWSYIDKPTDGQVYLIFVFPSAPTAMPPDGIHWLDQEKIYRLPVHNSRELEVTEVKYGFVPCAEMNASRVRRRFRLTKGGNPQLMLIHYLRGESIAIPQHIMNNPIRSYPLRPTNEPRLYVAGERAGQRVAPSTSSGFPAASQAHPSQLPHANGIGITMGLNLGLSHTAALGQQNQAMDGLERERRSRAIANTTVQQRPADEGDSGDEYDNVSTRSIAVERFKRNHEIMAEVFTQASKGPRKGPLKLPSPYAALELDQMNQQIEKLNMEVAALKAKAEERRLATEAAEARAEAEQRKVVDVAPLGT